jgi:hypothetical protein
VRKRFDTAFIAPVRDSVALLFHPSRIIQVRAVKRRATGILAAALVLSATSTEAGYGVTVTDCRTGRPIPGAIVTAVTSESVPGRPREVRTGDQGYSEVYPSPPDRQHQFSVAAPGYEAKSRSLFIASTAVTRENVCLEPALVQPAPATPTAPRVATPGPASPPPLSPTPAPSQPGHDRPWEPGPPTISPGDRARDAAARARGLVTEGEPPVPALPLPGAPSDEGKDLDRVIDRLGRLISQQPPSQVAPPVPSDCDAEGQVIPVQDPGSGSHTLETDGKKTIERKTTTASPTADEWFKKHKETVEKNGGYVVSEPRAGSNCFGYAFNMGETFIEPADVKPKILTDNYTEIAVSTCKQACICDVIIYGGKDGADHVGYVIELDDKGKPAMVVSQWGDGNGVFVHRPADYKGAGKSKDYEIHRRKPQAETDTTQKLQKEYDKAVQDQATATGATAKEDECKRKFLPRDPKDNDATTAKAIHAKAIELCREKNALTRVTRPF